MRSSPSRQGGPFGSAGGLDILRACRGQIGVGQHRAFGRAGRAAGILNDGQRFGQFAERMDLIAPVVVDEIAERHVAIVALHFRQHSCGRHLRLDRTRGERHLGELANDQGFQPRRSEQLFRLRIDRREVERDEDFGLAVFDLELERAQRVQGRIVDDRAAGFQHAEKGDDVVGRVGHEDADVHARPNTELLKSRGGAVRERVQFRIGYLLVHELKRRERAKSLGGRFEDALHRREFERRVPAHARRIGLQPGLGIHRLSSRSPALQVVSADVWPLSWPIRRRTVKQPRCEAVSAPKRSWRQAQTGVAPNLHANF